MRLIKVKDRLLADTGLYICLVKRIRISLLLMLLTILLVALGQVYWLRKLYADEYTNLKSGVDASFRTSFFHLQRNRFLQDTLLFSTNDSVTVKPQAPIKTKRNRVVNSFKYEMLLSDKKDSSNGQSALKSLNQISPDRIQAINIIKAGDKALPPPELMEVFIRQAQKRDSVLRAKGSLDSVGSKQDGKVSFMMIFRSDDSVKKKPADTIVTVVTPNARLNKPVITNQPVVRLFSSNKTLNDSIPLAQVDSVFKAALATKQQDLPYQIVFRKWQRDSLPLMTEPRDTLNGFITAAMVTGFTTPYTYQALFTDANSYLLQQIQWQLIGSIGLIALLITAFGFMYQNLRRQQRLADMKNEFISNITHELKTPIATVNVAIEALRNFNAIQNPEKTKEYLDISGAELQRLGLLVDKVLKLSMFEKDAVHMQMEMLDLQQLIQEVVQTMRLQFDKVYATVQLETEGQYFTIQADRMHMISVVYNLLDNALKYSEGKPVITIKLISKSPHIYLQIADQGIGIPKAYQQKVFEKFFRVPSNDRHNAKGYGLGLSYVAHIVQQHGGQIAVTDNQPKGSVFTVQLPIA
jgi:signal transduction histidine kinase